MHIRVLTKLFMLTFVTGCALEKETMTALHCEMTINQDNQVHMTLTNQSQQTIRVLKWFTPFEGFFSHMFNIEVDGNPLAYQGPMAKRLQPDENDYMVIAAGAAKTIEVPIQLVYDMSQPGVYSIAFNREFQATFADSAEDATEVKVTSCQPIMLENT